MVVDTRLLTINHCASGALQALDVPPFFYQIQPYPWDSAVLDAKADRHLIEKHGYLRRLTALQVVVQALQMC